MFRLINWSGRANFTWHWKSFGFFFLKLLFTRIFQWWFKLVSGRYSILLGSNKGALGSFAYECSLTGWCMLISLTSFPGVFIPRNRGLQFPAKKKGKKSSSNHRFFFIFREIKSPYSISKIYINFNRWEGHKVPEQVSGIKIPAFWCLLLSLNSSGLLDVNKLEEAYE